MNKRIFLFGVGVGIIVGAALLQLMLIGEKQADSLNDDIQEVHTYTQAELDKAVFDEHERVEKEQQLQAADTIDKPEKAAVDPETKPTVKPAANSAKSEDVADESKTSRIIVRIPPNASVAETAALLADSGVIPDKTAFIDLMRKKTIRAGYFAFQGRLTLQQVGGIITSQPLDPKTAQNEMAAGKG